MSTGPVVQERILIVDDAPVNIKLLGQALKPRYQVIVATRGAAALELALTAPHPDLILLDVEMPEMDGYEVCRRLKTAAVTRDIPVIFITARCEEADETLGLELGAVDYITKPFSLPIVAARVRTHLELKHHRDMLQDLSNRDGLTGIHNRRRLDEALRVEWRRAAREGQLLSLILIDIDHFKLFNDRYGHLGGDDCLRRVAGVLSSMAGRAGDLVARYGGEEFAVVLPGANADAAMSVAEKMRRAVEGLQIPHEGSSAADHVTVSLGAATVAPPTAGPGEEYPTALVQAADRALYAAKEGGRNRAVCLESDPWTE